MNRIIILTISASAALLSLAGCQKWEDYNTNPFGVTPELLAADFNDVGAYFPSIQQGIYNNTCQWAWEMQTATNLTADTWCGYMMSANPFQGNINPSTLFLIRGWVGGHWDLTYRDVMSPIFTSIEKQCGEQYPHFYAIAQILRGVAMLRVTDAYGPVVYSKYGQSATGSAFDTQKEAYDHLFKELDEAIATLTKYVEDYPDAKPFQPFDLLNGGDNVRWIKFANSIKLRAAVRISKVDPALAKKMAEEAVSHKHGVLEDGVVAVSGKGWVNPLSTLDDWTDNNMNAEMESILVGYNDPRLPKYFLPAADAAVQAAGFEYKGIRMGINITKKDTYVNHSRLNTQPDGAGIIMTAAEIWFLRAEGALRGWSGMGGTAQSLYEKGVATSFAQWGAGSADDYLKSNNMPAAYVDIYNPDNNIPADSPYMNKVSPKWDESASNEIKLQKIITQKWIACFPEGVEAWSEQRRTGYPVLFPVMVNESQGVFKNTDNVKRMTFPESLEWSGQIEEARSKLGGPDNGNTRLWWDTGKANF